MKKYLSFLMIAMLTLLAACSSDDDNDKTVYTVTFETDGGTPVPSAQKVEEGSTVTAPATNPTKAGYVFVYWHESGATTAYNFQTPVSKDFTLHAKWQEEAQAEYWQVTWELNGGSWPADDNHAILVIKGGTLSEPNAPTKAGNTFDGWYKESGLTNKVTFPYDVSNLTANFTLYAKWTTEGGKEEPIVYVSGYVKNASGISVAKVWKDGKELYSLTDGTKNGEANEIFVVGGDVYIAGIEQSANGNYIAKVWKNGVELYALNPDTESRSAKSICVSGNDVYVTGALYSPSTYISKPYPKVWKNGIELYPLTSIGNGNVSKICVLGNDVYVSGEEASNAKVWKNGIVYWTSDVSGYGANADYMYISGEKIYVSMNLISGTASLAKVNPGEILMLYEYGHYGSNSGTTADIQSFAVSGDNVYAAMVVRHNYVPRPTQFYKNNTLLYSFGGVQYMYLFGEDLYHTGKTSENALKVWKNETELYTLHEGGNSGVTSIVVAN